jgi:hypothetical protein
VWLANPVVVPKANGKLRMCIDYTNLNKACPKDPYPLPRIDQIETSCASQGCAEVDGVSCSPQPLHFKVGREGVTLLQADEGVRSICMD